MVKRMRTKEFRKELEKMSIDELIKIYVGIIKKLEDDFDNNELVKIFIIVREEICKRDQDYFLEKVKELGVYGALAPDIVLMEHTKYELHERGETNKDIKRRLRENNLRPFICAVVMATVPAKVQARITAEDIDSVVEAFAGQYATL